MRLWQAGVVLVTLASSAAAQTAGSAPTRTTQSGVFSAEQADRGKDIYAGYCRSCHTAESHTGATFVATWRERPLVELFAFMRDRMPKNEPGSLSDQEYVDVMTYVLKMNGMPAGVVELPADTGALARIKIHFPATAASREKH